MAKTIDDVDLNTLTIDDYVRTDDGLIGKIFKKYRGIQNATIYKVDIPNESFNYTNVFELEVVKSSPNILDLIEEDDLVKIEYYSPKYRKRITRLFVVEYKDIDYIRFANSHCEFNIFHFQWVKQDKHFNPTIKSIVTHEQFESMEYRIRK